MKSKIEKMSRMKYKKTIKMQNSQRIFIGMKTGKIRLEEIRYDLGKKSKQYQKRSKEVIIISKYI